MTGSTDMVQEFRGVVDGVIADQVAQCERDRREWPGFNTIARTVGLDFVSKDMPSGLSTVFEHCGGHLWGVGDREAIRFGGRVGSLAVMSFLNDEEHLYRKIAIKGPIQLIPRSVTLKLDDRQMETVLRWVQSPHIAGEALHTMVGLTSEESDILTAQLDEDTRQREVLNRDLESMRPHRLPGTIG